MDKKRRICLVTTAHISYNPRLIKEANALCEAGYKVSVVSPILEAIKRDLDEQIAESSGWIWKPVDVRNYGVQPRFRRIWCSVVQETLQGVVGKVQARWLQDRAFSRYLGPLFSLAAREAADMYIAHNLPALPVAWRAATVTGAVLGFDGEDYHRGEFRKGLPEDQRPLYELTKKLEERYIPLAKHFTVASPGIGEAYRNVLKGVDPVGVLNVFPLSDRAFELSREEIKNERKGESLSLYWYSQVIGPDRGLGDVLAAVSKLEGVHLSLRGAWACDFKGKFLQDVRRMGIEDRVDTLDPVPPEELVVRASLHDVGLALETPEVSENRDVCVTNKILVYLLAGNAVAATDTRGQRDIMDQAGEVGFVFRPGDVGTLAAGLRRYRDDPHALNLAKARSKTISEERLCWEKEKEKLIAAVGRAVGYRSLR